MEALKPGEIRVYLKNSNYICPELNKGNVIRCLGDAVLRIEHYKPPTAAPAPTATPIGKTRESLLGKILKRGKSDPKEVIKWIEGCKSAEDILIVLKDEKRVTVKKAGKQRITDLI